MNRTIILIKLFILSIIAELIKLYYKITFFRFAKKLNKKEDRRKKKVIISLTSYGRRVSATAPYTLCSLLRQSYVPDDIVLWLDTDNWNENNLPSSIISLQKKGITVRFCKDLKSYKKFVPAMQEYPEALIVTCDDDIYYRSNMVDRLIEEYDKDSNRIYAHRAHLITFDNDGELNKYNEWQEEISGFAGNLVFPTSGGGTLYSKDLLYKDCCNEDLFMKLSPKADDVWLYFMGILKGTENYVLPWKRYIYIPLDVFYQTFHSGSNLSSDNCKESMNDVQFKQVMNYYNIKVKNKVLVQTDN